MLYMCTCGDGICVVCVYRRHVVCVSECVGGRHVCCVSECVWGGMYVMCLSVYGGSINVVCLSMCTEARGGYWFIFYLSPPYFFEIECLTELRASLAARRLR